MEKDGKFFFGVYKVGEKGQIIIPKKCREVFNINPGDSVAILGDVNQGIALVKMDDLKAFDELLKKKE